jgi:hypothetical protein
LVPLFEDDIFKKHLQLLIEDEILRQKMGEAALADISRFSADKVATEYYEFITSNVER